MLIFNCLKIFCGEVLEAFVILPSYDLATVSAILLPIKSQVNSAVLRNALFEIVPSASVMDCLG